MLGSNVSILLQMSGWRTIKSYYFGKSDQLCMYIRYACLCCTLYVISASNVGHLLLLNKNVVSLLRMALILMVMSFASWKAIVIYLSS